MKIKYAFLDGTVTEVEVSDEIGAVIIDSRKAEHAQDERHRYHCYHAEGVLSYIAANGNAKPHGERQQECGGHRSGCYSAGVKCYSGEHRGHKEA